MQKFKLMIELTEFAKNFNGLETPIELVKLLEFTNEISNCNYYSEGFELIVDTEKAGLKTCSEDQTFLSSIIGFANADHTGSIYGFWLINENKNFSEAPIIVFGSEGGSHIIAKNIRELFQILTFDSQPMVDWDDVSFYKDLNNYEPSTFSQVFKDLLQETFNLAPIENPNLIVEKAQAKYQAELKNWFKNYYQE